MNAAGVNPSRHEIERQLDRILADEAIASHPQPAKLLAFIVGRAMKGEEVTEKLIREFVFPNPPYKEDSNIARITMEKVRKLLADYYDDEGEDDPVIVSLPKSPEGRRIKFQAGQAYTPNFSYNRRSAIAKQFAIVHHFLRGGIAQLDQGVKKLAEIQKMEPGHPETALSFAEATACQLMFGLFIEEGRAPLIAGLLALIGQLDPAIADPWRIRNVRGLLFTVNGELEKAKTEFANALRIDRQSTISRGWYTHFLFVTGHEEEALQLGELNADENASNAQAQAIYGVYLCAGGRYEEAERVLTQSLALDRNCWAAHFGLTQLYLATEKWGLALKHGKRLEALVEPEEYESLKYRLEIKPRTPGRSV